MQGKIDSSVIESVPDLNHNPFYFATLLAGVVARNELTSTTNPYSFGVGIYSRDNMSAFSVNGSGAFSSDITVDGVSVMGAQMNEALVLPNRDGIQEVRAITNNFSAEYGRGQGAVAVITKSGTNQYHGSLFDQSSDQASLEFAVFRTSIQRTPSTITMPLDFEPFAPSPTLSPVWERMLTPRKPVGPMTFAKSRPSLRSVCGSKPQPSPYEVYCASSPPV